MGTAATDLLTDLGRLGVELVADGDRLRYRPQSALTPDLADRLRSHKAELLAILGSTVRPEAANLPIGPGASIRWEESIDPPDPCPGCGGLVFWWNVLGDRRCMKCDPPHPRARRLRQLAQQLRNKAEIQ